MTASEQLFRVRADKQYENKDGRYDCRKYMLGEQTERQLSIYLPRSI